MFWKKSLMFTKAAFIWSKLKQTVYFKWMLIMEFSILKFFYQFPHIMFSTSIILRTIINNWAPIIIKHQAEWFKKDHETMKTRVITAINSALPSQEKMYFKMYSNSYFNL